MKGTNTDRALALGGIFQACALVKQIAHKGMVDTDLLTTTLDTLFVQNPHETIDVFGGIEGVEYGLRRLHEQLGTRQADMELTQYVIGVLVLERKLSKDPGRLGTLQERLDQAERQKEMFGLVHENTVNNLAGIYSEVISTLTPRIMVQGSNDYLDQAHNANRIRALLLAAIRCAVLWRQVGGSRWKLVFGRKRLVNSAMTLLDSL
ncbi:MAG: high frequency lysogenization protein HflD [Thiohalospira sp.]